MKTVMKSRKKPALCRKCGLFPSTKLSAARPDLAGEGNNAVVGCVMFCNTVPNGINVRGKHQQAHTAGQFSLNGPGRGRNARFQSLALQQILQGKTVGVIGKQDVIMDFFGH
jgi:hypothetical protein